MADEPTTKEIPAALHGPSSSLAGLRILVTGLGVTGFPAAVHLGERGADVIVIDGDATADVSEKAQILEVFDVDIRRGPEHVEALPEGEFDLVVTSPGWRPDQPVLAAATKAGIPVIGEVELAWRIRGTNDAKWLAITGTNGKTTTTTMLESMLLAAGLKAKACGNIGTPLLEAVLEPGLEALAIELSSFQLHWQESMSADAAAVLNIAPDHLDWHGSAEAYAADKAKIFHNAKLACVYNCADEVTLHMVEDADVIEGAKAIGFTTGVPRPGELGVVEDLLVDRAFIPQRYSSAAELASLDDVATATGVARSRPASHQVANALAAACLARAIDVPGQAIAAGLQNHSLGAHRMVTVAEADGIRWVDDSKATNTHAANASLAAFDSIIWIAGGLPKGADFTSLFADHRERLKALVLIGSDDSAYREAIAATIPDLEVVRIEPALAVDSGVPKRRGEAVAAAAVDAAARLAEAGDTVLLAPAAASMDQFLNYNTRGDLFAEAVNSHLER
ncbi:UDP-N-acetylmuramoylalanine--D-glutamate ligase [Brevibacterium sediminis]|uniref:UDP-N-acetylmuramoylalanine--D-glutamate ligase n=1 Tax=Brevibacterium sediminis TaxID=1857024 RepID=A0ABQ1MHQ1_9MICO|nr:UDP-N-acetylmuramoyl-L-alanine--D-glutamate ligase [Brevibacterium sediminis]GGC40707.1 UDP-N-acetylmuramoylalanine--D-glutamate ligase [Brevibacterium sediminis]